MLLALLSSLGSSTFTPLDSSAAAIAAASRERVIGTAHAYASSTLWNAIPSSPTSYTVVAGTVLSFTYS